jgi:dUTP pyrophosphatase
MIIRAGERKLVQTGLAAVPPPHMYLRIAPRSGLARKGIDVGAGVVDADYRGEIRVLLINNSPKPLTVQPGDRIAQMILEQILMTNPTLHPYLPKSKRGT